MLNRTSLIAVLLFSFSLNAYAQQNSAPKDREAEKVERRAKIIDALQRDAGELRLAENRAFITAKLGAVLWKDDPERATTLFTKAVADLIAAQTLAESTKSAQNQNYDLVNSQSLRPAVLNAIASVDAEFALNSLHRSRPISVQRALAQTLPNQKINSTSANHPYLAQQEINLEQRFIRMIGDQKPERSIAFLKETIRKQLSGETLTMLKKVWSKDSSAGNELANDVVDRLVSKRFIGPNEQPNYELINLASSLLGEYLRQRAPEERSIAFAESGMRSLAAKLISTYIERGGMMGYIPLEQLEPIAKRFSPGSYEVLKKAAVNTRNGSHRGFQPDEAYGKLIEGNPTADVLIAEAKNFPLETRRSIYSTAANKLSEAGQYDRAVALLSDNFEDDALENAMQSLNWYHAHHLMNRGEFDAAETMIMQFNENNRVAGLIMLATSVHNKDPRENRTRANGILQRTRTLLPERPETNSEFSQIMQVINAMANVEHAEAFRNFEPAVDQINQLIEAWAVVSSFQGGSIRQGEYLLASGFSFGLYIEPSIFRTLAEKEFDRTMRLIDSFHRREMRILIYTSLLEGGF